MTSFLPSQAYGKSRVSGKRQLWVLVVAEARLALEAWASKSLVSQVRFLVYKRAIPELTPAGKSV